MTEPKHFESLYPPETREEELSQAVRYIIEGNSCQIIGLPGVGRSNLLGLLAYNKAVREKHFPSKQSWIHVVMVNFSEVRSRPVLDAFKLLFLSLADSLRERGKIEEYEYVNAIFRETLALQDELVLSQGLKRAVDYLAVEKKLTLIFLCDRFEEYVPMLTPEFFATLRVLRNRAKYRFSLLFALHKPLEDILEPTLLADFYEFVAGHIIYLSLLDEPSNTFRLGYLEKLTGKEVPGPLLKEILALTAGHGKLTRLAAEAVLAQPEEFMLRAEQGGVEKSNETLEDFLLTQRPIQGALEAILRSLTPVEQKALVQPDTGVGEHPEVKDYLERVGLLDGEKVALPLIARYLSREKKTDQGEKTQIFFDTEKNAIRKGELVLSDGLTAAEFRLLAYLLRNPERVIERDEIISVVWKDAASTAGVTDQAVDQLVFRLRRKIEENPNQPQHLHTVKGRGFSFTT